MIIRPDLLAGKLEAGDFGAPNLAACPRLRDGWRELLWFLQFAGSKPGGLERLVETLLADYAPRFVTSSMREAGQPIDGRYSLAQCLVAWKTFDSRLAARNVVRSDAEADSDLGLRAGNSDRFEDFLPMHYPYGKSLEQIQDGRGPLLAGCERFNWPFLNDLCLRHARGRLEKFLVDLCVEKSTGFQAPWYCDDLFNVLLDYMERHAATVLQGIAQTEVSRIVFRELEFSLSENAPCPIVGESRIGKTSAASVWCSSRPGRARLVTVPQSNREADFVRAHADAFGIEYGPSMTMQRLKWTVEYVHLHSGLFVVYEEAQFLIPARYAKTTPPARLDWVRQRVIDCGLGCAFIATSQSYHQTLDQYVKTTGHKMEQWLGRLATAVVLPADLGAEDMLAVARLHFPDLQEPHLKRIAAHAMLSEGYLQHFEMTAKRARFLARERGHAVGLDEVNEAIAQMMPGTVAPRPVSASPAAPAQSGRPTILDGPSATGRRPSAEDLSGSEEPPNRLPKGANELKNEAA